MLVHQNMMRGIGCGRLAGRCCGEWLDGCHGEHRACLSIAFYPALAVEVIDGRFEKFL